MNKKMDITVFLDVSQTKWRFFKRFLMSLVLQLHS